MTIEKFIDLPVSSCENFEAKISSIFDKCEELIKLMAYDLYTKANTKKIVARLYISRNDYVVKVNVGEGDSSKDSVIFAFGNTFDKIIEMLDRDIGMFERLRSAFDEI